MIELLLAKKKSVDAKYFYRIRSFISSVKKQGLDVLLSLQNMFDGKCLLQFRTE